jgi:ubiquinone/menaquinone biosynthesis C-methylase UbiE
MGLVTLSEVASLLTCPRCGSPLAVSKTTCRCVSACCELSTALGFPVVGTWPVLVDFERSILRADEIVTSDAVDAGGYPGTSRWSIERLPGRLRSWWKPQNSVAAKNVEALLRLLPEPSPLVLVVGGGTMGNGVDALYAAPRVRVLGFDIYGSPLTRFIADAHRIPLATGTVDAVLIQAVLEHVLEPQQVVGEIKRVLRDGGIVYAETPFLQQVHSGPYDFTRFTSSGHRYLFRGFEEISAGPVAGPGTQLLWSIDHLVRGLLRSQLSGKLVRALLFWLRSLDRLVPVRFAMDDASAYYFLGRSSDTELTPHEIVAYYRGAQTPSSAPENGGGSAPATRRPGRSTHR